MCLESHVNSQRFIGTCAGRTSALTRGARRSRCLQPRLETAGFLGWQGEASKMPRKALGAADFRGVCLYGDTQKSAFVCSLTLFPHAANAQDSQRTPELSLSCEDFTEGQFVFLPGSATCPQGRTTAPSRRPSQSVNTIGCYTAQSQIRKQHACSPHDFSPGTCLRLSSRGVALALTPATRSKPYFGRT